MQDSTGLVSSCWEQIEAAAANDRGMRSALYAFYEPAVRAFFCARWGLERRHGRVRQGIQEVFLELFRPGATSEHAAAARGSFRDFLWAILCAAARRMEEEAATAKGDPSARFSVEAEGEVLHAFERSWARTLVRRAGALHRERANERRGGAMLRCQLMELRFNEGLSLGAAGVRMGLQGDALSSAYAKACREFAAALREVVRVHDPGRPEEVDRTCQELGRLLH